MQRRGNNPLIKTVRKELGTEKRLKGNGLWKVVGERQDGNCIVLCRYFKEQDAAACLDTINKTEGIDGFVRFFVHYGRIDPPMG